ncbi:MAG: DUF3987 domain-containing protein [Desulfobacterales bacterium]|nr:DUF3987 domain-containing protein [Desulfobacterales bacterium]
MARPKKIEKKSFQLEFDFKNSLKVIETSEEARDLIIAMIAAKNRDRSQWRGVIAIPPTSLLDSIISQFRLKTNIPLEIPFFTFFSILSGYLLNKNINLILDDMLIKPDVWTVVLASSGAGKTYTEKKISNGLNEVMKDIEFRGTGCVSSATFVDRLSEKPHGLWIRDEFAQFLKQIENPNGPLSDMKDYLLRLHDNSTISRETKKNGNIEIEDPALSILGLTVFETFKCYVTTESMLDGFAQRFSYVIAEADPTRHFLNYPLWQIDNKSWQLRWDNLVKKIQPAYYGNKDSITAFSTSFQTLYNQQIPESFYRRIMWKAHKYAMLYHVLKEDISSELKAEDYGWAARALSLHIDDAAFLIGDHNISAIERIIQSAEKLYDKIAVTKHREATARDLISGVNAIKNAGQANAILSIIKGAKKFQ